MVYGAVLAIYWYITGPVPHMTLFFARRLSYSLWALGFLAILALFWTISWFFSRLRTLRDESQDTIDLTGWVDKKRSTTTNDTDRPE